MSQSSHDLNAIEKKCQETDCLEKIAALNEEELELFNSFTYCPYCAEELILVCGSCQESIASDDFNFCPWCGQKFSE